MENKVRFNKIQLLNKLNRSPHNGEESHAPEKPSKGVSGIK